MDDHRKILFGSEPDLRYSGESTQNYGPTNHQSSYNNNNKKDDTVKTRIGKSKKKYKAPLAPHINSVSTHT